MKENVNKQKPTLACFNTNELGLKHVSLNSLRRGGLDEMMTDSSSCESDSAHFPPVELTIPGNGGISFLTSKPNSSVVRNDASTHVSIDSFSRVGVVNEVTDSEWSCESLQAGSPITERSIPGKRGISFRSSKPTTVHRKQALKDKQAESRASQRELQRFTDTGNVSKNSCINGPMVSAMLPTHRNAYHQEFVRLITIALIEESDRSQSRKFTDRLQAVSDAVSLNRVIPGVCYPKLHHANKHCFKTLNDDVDFKQPGPICCNFFALLYPAKFRHSGMFKKIERFQSEVLVVLGAMSLQSLTSLVANNFLFMYTFGKAYNPVLTNWGMEGFMPREHVWSDAREEWDAETMAPEDLVRVMGDLKALLMRQWKTHCSMMKQSKKSHDEDEVARNRKKYEVLPLNQSAYQKLMKVLFDESVDRKVRHMRQQRQRCRVEVSDDEDEQHLPPPFSVEVAQRTGNLYQPKFRKLRDCMQLAVEPEEPIAERALRIVPPLQLQVDEAMRYNARVLRLMHHVFPDPSDQIPGYYLMESLRLRSAALDRKLKDAEKRGDWPPFSAIALKGATAVREFCTLHNFGDEYANDLIAHHKLVDPVDYAVAQGANMSIMPSADEMREFMEPTIDHAAHRFSASFSRGIGEAQTLLSETLTQTCDEFTTRCINPAIGSVTTAVSQFSKGFVNLLAELSEILVTFARTEETHTKWMCVLMFFHRALTHFDLVPKLLDLLKQAFHYLVEKGRDWWAAIREFIATIREHFVSVPGATDMLDSVTEMVFDVDMEQFVSVTPDGIAITNSNGTPLPHFTREGIVRPPPPPRRVEFANANGYTVKDLIKKNIVDTLFRKFLELAGNAISGVRRLFTWRTVAAEMKIVHPSLYCTLVGVQLIANSGGVLWVSKNPLNAQVAGRIKYHANICAAKYVNRTDCPVSPPALRSLVQQANDYCIGDAAVAGQSRVGSVIVVIFGDPGQGKTYCMNTLNQRLNKRMGVVPVSQCFPFPDDDEKFFDGYCGQKIVKMTDIFKALDKSTRCKEANMIMRAADTDAYSLPMSKTWQKGEVFFDSEFVVVTTNYPIHKADASEWDHWDKGALKRRINIYVEQFCRDKRIMKMVEGKLAIDAGLFKEYYPDGCDPDELYGFRYWNCCDNTGHTCTLGLPELVERIWEARNDRQHAYHGAKPLDPLILDTLILSKTEGEAFVPELTELDITPNGDVTITRSSSWIDKFAKTCTDYKTELTVLATMLATAGVFAGAWWMSSARDRHKVAQALAHEQYGRRRYVRESKDNEKCPGAGRLGMMIRESKDNEKCPGAGRLNMMVREGLETSIGRQLLEVCQEEGCDIDKVVEYVRELGDKIEAGDSAGALGAVALSLLPASIPKLVTNVAKTVMDFADVGVPDTFASEECTRCYPPKAKSFELIKPEDFSVDKATLRYATEPREVKETVLDSLIADGVRQGAEIKEFFLNFQELDRTVLTAHPIQVLKPEPYQRIDGATMVPYVAQGCDSPQALETAGTRVILQTYWANFLREGKCVSGCQAFNICDRFVVVPRHTWFAWEKYYDTLELIGAGTFMIGRDYVKFIRNMHAQEIVILELHKYSGFKQGYDLRKKIIPAEMLDFCRGSVMTVTRLPNKYHNVAFFGSAALELVDSRVCNDSPNCPGFKLVSAFRYPLMQTFEGMCASPVLIMDKSITASIFGFHCAGSPGCHGGICAPVTREMFEFLTPLMRPVAIPCATEVTAETAASMGQARCQGYVTPCMSQRQCTKTNIVPTRLFNKFHITTKAPAALRPRGNRDPMLLGQAKWFGPTGTIQMDWLKEIVDFRARYYARLFTSKGFTLRTLSLVEAACGTKEDGQDAIPMKTSPGYPFNSLKNGNKRGWLSLFHETRQATLDPYLRECCDDMEALLAQGVAPPVIFRDTLKDEKRAKEKVALCKTRVFAAAPVDFVLVFRRYFLDFVSKAMLCCTECPLAIGVNPHGDDWAALKRDLDRIPGDNNGAGDLVNHDGTVWAIWIYMAFSMIQKVYAMLSPCEADNAALREALAESTANSYHIVDNALIWMNHCVPSGLPITSILNAIILDFYHLYGWKKRGYAVCDYDTYVASHMYGDDSMIRVHPDRADFSMLSLKEDLKDIGVTYTPSKDKSSSVDTPFISMIDVTFLKRGFVERDGIVYAPLDIETVMDFPNWSRSDTLIDERTLFIQMFEQFCDELTHYPPEQYLYECDRLADLMGKEGIASVSVPPYHKHRSRYT